MPIICPLYSFYQFEVGIYVDQVHQSEFIGEPQGFSAMISSQLISLWEHSHEPWGAKDRHSRYLYANQAYCKLLNLSPKFSFEGLSDNEIPHPTAEFALQFYKHDRKVQELKRSVSAIDIYPYGSEKIIQPYICEKFPFYDEDRMCVGIIFHIKKLQITSFIQYLNMKSVEPLDFCLQKKSFTDKELEVIFFLLQSMSCQVIAKRLNIAQRTINNKLQSMYKKAGVNSLSNFKKFCRIKGYTRYVAPKSIILPQEFSTFSACYS